MLIPVDLRLGIDVEERVIKHGDKCGCNDAHLELGELDDEQVR